MELLMFLFVWFVQIFRRSSAELDDRVRSPASSDSKILYNLLKMSSNCSLVLASLIAL